MRLIPIVAAATIGLFATAAVAQNMNTADQQRSGRVRYRRQAGETSVGCRNQAGGHRGSEQRPGRVRHRRQAEACVRRRDQRDEHRSEQRHHQRAEHGRQAQGQEKEDEQYVTNGKSVWLNAAAPEKRGGFFVAGGRYVILAARNGPVYSCVGWAKARSAEPTRTNQSRSLSTSCAGLTRASMMNCRAINLKPETVDGPHGLPGQARQ